MDQRGLLARMAAQREASVTLPNGKRLQYRRPPEVELPRLAGGVLLQHVIEYACGWEKFTEADLLGAGDGGDAEVPFSRELWEAYAKDHFDAVQVVANAMAETVSEYLKRKAEVSGNSQPSST